MLILSRMISGSALVTVVYSYVCSYLSSCLEYSVFDQRIPLQLSVVVYHIKLY